MWTCAYGVRVRVPVLPMQELCRRASYLRFPLSRHRAETPLGPYVRTLARVRGSATILRAPLPRTKGSAGCYGRCWSESSAASLRQSQELSVTGSA